MANRVLPTRLDQTPQTLAIRYLKTIGRAVGIFFRKVRPIDEKIAELENQLEELKARREKAKPRIAVLARRFRVFAERHRAEFLPGDKKSVNTEAGKFGWANNSEGLICEDESAAIMDIIRNKRFDLLRTEIRRKETSAAIKSGESFEGCSVGCKERFVITPVGQPPVTVCGDDPVRIGKDELVD